MATLGAAVGADDPVITTDVPVTITGNYPARYTLDSEAVYVIGGSGTTSLSVLRGQDNTAKASHAVGTTLASAPIGSGGGGGVTVDNQSDPPTAVTTLVVPGATLDDGTADLSSISGVQRVRLLGPFRLAYDTPGFVNPADNGIEVVSIPSGSLCRAIVVTGDEEFDTVSGDELDVLLGTSAETVIGMAAYLPPSSPGVAGAELLPMTTEAGVMATGIPRFALALTNLSVVAALYANTPPTQGNVDLYALIAEPA